MGPAGPRAVESAPAHKAIAWCGLLIGLTLGAVSSGCARPRWQRPAAQPATEPVAWDLIPQAPWRTYGSEAAGHEPTAHPPPVLLRGAKFLIGDGSVIERGHLLMIHGLIGAVGPGDGALPPGGLLVDVKGKVITPGLIDVHSHLGVYASPAAKAHLDGNEISNPMTPEARVIDAFWPQDPNIQRAVAGGVTTVQILPGSTNLVGGRGTTLKLRPATTSREMHFRGAPDGLKMACGENPKRIYGNRKDRAPVSRMGNLAILRQKFLAAQRLIDRWDRWRKKERRRRSKLQKQRAIATERQELRERQRRECEAGRHSRRQCADWQRRYRNSSVAEPADDKSEPPPARDIALETLAAVLEGRILVHVHCYRADDMATMIALAEEVGFSIRAFHHAIEAYKIRSQLALHDIAAVTWPDWWGFKMEAYDGIVENLALLATAGVRATVHSDSPVFIRRLNQEAAKAMYAGQHAGLAVDQADAIAWLTLHPAWTLGIDRWVGTLTYGKQADVVVWDGDPFSVYTRAERVYIDGFERFRSGAKQAPWSDFEVSP